MTTGDRIHAITTGQATDTRHQLDQVLVFDLPDGRQLDTYQCKCGGLFDAARWAVHTEREARS